MGRSSPGRGGGSETFQVQRLDELSDSERQNMIQEKFIQSLEGHESVLSSFSHHFKK